MYTTIDLTELQYELNIDKKDYTFIKDIEEFILGLALGLIEVNTILIDKGFHAANKRDIIELQENIKFTYIEDLYSSKVLVERDINNTSHEINDLESRGTEMSNTAVEVETEVIDQGHKNDVKESSKEKVKGDRDSVKEKTNLFGRIFKGGRKKDLASVEIDLGSGIEDKLREDYTRGKFFKKMLVEEGHLTENEVIKVEEIIEENKRLGTTKFFIQVCREQGILTEDKCAKLLSKGTTTEILCKDVLESQLDLIAEYNKELYQITDRYFIVDVDTEKNTVAICKDFIDQPNTYYLEKLYPGYEIILKNVVEGVTKEMHDLISVHIMR